MVLGSAGTGKTSAGVSVAERWFEKASGNEIAYVSFTRDAARVAAGRVCSGDVDEADDVLPLFRTIHSLCYRWGKGVRMGVSVATPADLKQFSRESGMEGAYAVNRWEELADIYQNSQNQGKTDWDKCLSAYNVSRLTARTVSELDRSKRQMSESAIQLVGSLHPDLYSAFVSKYDAFREREGLMDFCDMLDYALRFMPPMEVRCAIIDECQDNCPLIWAICKKLFEDTSEEVWYLGDDWQMVYSFSGVDPEDFLSTARECRQIVLRQTHRFGREVVDMAGRIVKRIVRRIDKEVLPHHGRTNDIRVTGEFKPIHGNYLLLHRHVAGCQALAKDYMMAGVPFVNERGRSPLEAPMRTVAYEALDTLSKDKAVTLEDARLVISELLPSVVVSEKSKVRLVVHGAKQKMAERKDTETLVRLGELVMGEILTPAGATAIAQHDYSAMHHSEDLSYYARVLKNGHSLNPSGTVITTIHASKGREANDVVVFSEMGRRCWDNPDGEHRLAYVAATRTKGSLTICMDRKVGWASTDYNYPSVRNEK